MSYPLGKRMIWHIPVKDVDPVEVKICGLAAIGVAILGETYIVELPHDFRVTGEDYPYTHTAAFECHLEPIG